MCVTGRHKERWLKLTPKHVILKTGSSCSQNHLKLTMWLFAEVQHSPDRTQSLNDTSQKRGSSCSFGLLVLKTTTPRSLILETLAPAGPGWFLFALSDSQTYYGQSPTIEEHHYNLMAVTWLTHKFKKKKKQANKQNQKVPVYSFESHLQRGNQSHGTLWRKTW